MNQKCWAHLLRELRSVDDRPEGARDDWPIFAKKLRRIYNDAVRLAANEVMPQSERDSKVCALHGRVTDLACAEWTHPDARRLAKRLLTYGADLLTFVEFDGVPATNNRGERAARGLIVEGVLANLLDGGDARQGQEEAEVVMDFRVLAGNDFAVDEVFRLKLQAVPGEDELRRHKGKVLAASLVLVALLAGVMGTTWGLFRADNAVKRATAAETDARDQAVRVVGERDRAVRAEADAKQ
ncbi:hypothetical protein BH11PLA2_BH11PLA2_23520 [soil metagenome]